MIMKCIWEVSIRRSPSLTTRYIAANHDCSEQVCIIELFITLPIKGCAEGRREEESRAGSLRYCCGGGVKVEYVCASSKVS
jgi:hypothetical protein